MKLNKQVFSFGRFAFLALLVQLLLCGHLSAQVNLSGTITDSAGEPLIGASILVKGTSSGTVTDFEGKYAIEVADKDAVLVVSYTGYRSQEVAVGEQTTIDLVLETDQALLDEVVVVAYGKQKKVTVTGAVTALKGPELIKSPAVNLSNSLAGRLPGLVVIQQSGEPGNDGATVRIRGTNTLGNSNPLVVIDGIPDRAGGLGYLNPGDIESSLYVVRFTLYR